MGRGAIPGQDSCAEITGMDENRLQYLPGGLTRPQGGADLEIVARLRPHGLIVQTFLIEASVALIDDPTVQKCGPHASHREYRVEKKPCGGMGGKRSESDQSKTNQLRTKGQCDRILLHLWALSFFSSWPNIKSLTHASHQRHKTRISSTVKLHYRCM